METRLRRGRHRFRPLPACPQEREFGRLETVRPRFSPACRLVRQERKFWQLGNGSTAVFRPCRLSGRSVSFGS